MVRLSPAERRDAGPFAGGAALALDRESGQGIVYVFFDQVERVAAEGRVPLPLVLGLTIAHEVGHVLLPSGHRPSGIMKARLGRADWREASRGWLRFDLEASERMRARLGPLRSADWSHAAATRDAPPLGPERR